MEIRDFIGKVVIHAESKQRFLLREITSPYIMVESEKADDKGRRSRYIYRVMTSNPITDGTLIFEDKALTAPFTAAFEDYTHSRAAYWEDYGYWMRRD